MSVAARAPIGRPASARHGARPRLHLRLVHSRGRRLHGTRAKYVVDGCRCHRCRQANTAYWRERRRRPGPALIPAAAVRDHLRWLQERGVGRRQVAALSGVPESVVAGVRSGGRRRVSIATADRLLSVTADQPAAGALVDAAEARRLVELLVDAGRTRSWIAQELGATGRALRLGERTTTARARAIEDLARREGVSA